MRSLRPRSDSQEVKPIPASSESQTPLLQGQERKDSYESTGSRSDEELLIGEISGVQESVFDDPVLAHFYQPHYLYEGLHRFDPQAEWSKSDEARVVKKIDKKIMIWCCIMFIALQLDRQNISECFLNRSNRKLTL